jgi:Calcineurin-like phosphoesterase
VLTRRTVLRGAGGIGLAASTASSPRTSSKGRPVVGGKPVFTFVSTPDFMNGDVADLSVLPTWDGGLNSVNDAWRTAIDRCLGYVRDFQPDAVLVAGDLVEGRWNIDSDGRGLFGPVSQGTDPDSLAQCASAIDVAGDLHYSFYSDLFSSRGLTLYPAVGDHEILDDRPGPLADRWTPSGGTIFKPDNRYYLVDHSKDVWARHFTRPDGAARFARRPIGSEAEWTSYAVSFANAVTLITVDMFTRRSAGVQLGVFEGQLAWLTREIRRAKRKGHVVIVQGHVPTMTPARWLASGLLHLPEGRDSRFYRTVDREGADLFLCGEVHDSTAIQHGRSGPVQVSHGCVFRYAFSFLVGRVHEDGTVVLDLYEAPVTRASVEKSLWSSDSAKRQRTHIEYGEPQHRGRLVQRHRVISTRTGKLGVYHPGRDPYALVGNFSTVMV